MVSSAFDKFKDHMLSNRQSKSNDRDCSVTERAEVTNALKKENIDMVMLENVLSDTMKKCYAPLHFCRGHGTIEIISDFMRFQK